MKLNMLQSYQKFIMQPLAMEMLIKLSIKEILKCSMNFQNLHKWQLLILEMLLRHYVVLNMK